MVSMADFQKLWIPFLSLATFFALTAAQLLPTDPAIWDGPCRPIVPDRNYWALPVMSQAKVYAITMASQSCFRSYFSIFVGRRAYDQAELTNLCPTFIWTTPICILTGNTTETYINTGHFDRNDPMSQFIAMSPGVDPYYELNVDEKLVWSDGAHHGVFIRCINGEFMEWKLASSIMPSTKIKRKALKVIERYGFDPSHAVDMTDQNQNGGFPYPCGDIPTMTQAMQQAMNNLGCSDNASSRSK